MIHHISRQEFVDLVYKDTTNFMASITAFDGYVVKAFYSQPAILEFRSFLARTAEASEPSWHPCYDDCPDYHRINDEYPRSWVRAKMHSFYFHRWGENKEVFEAFKEILEMKNYLGGADKDAHYDAIPSSGVISRIVAHQYPRGGGYLEEHIDPENPFALIQTIVQASRYSEDFRSGGLYFKESDGAEAVFVDPHSEMGDLIVLSPQVRHGVALIDPEADLDWTRQDGRWMILPVIIRSDYNSDPETKPKRVAT